MAELRTVTRTLAAIELLAGSPTSLGVTELAARLAIAPSSAHRLLRALVVAGFAERDPDRGRYRAGGRLVALGGRVAAPLLREVGRPVLARLAEATGETAHLAVLDGLEVVALDHVGGPEAERGHRAGARIPAHATALGLVLLAHHPSIAEARIAAGLERWTEATAADADDLRRRLEQARRRGYAVNVRGWLPGTAGVAAPIALADGRVVAAVGLSGPATRLGRRGVLSGLAPVVRAAAREVAAGLVAVAPAHPRPSTP